MSAPTIVNGDISHLVAKVRGALATGVQNFTSHDLERILAIVCQCTTADLSALSNVAGDDTADGRPATNG